ncbi:MAG: MarR family winged helix-turn-helix transcriptional regulator [Bacteroidota bacterium]
MEQVSETRPSIVPQRHHEVEILRSLRRIIHAVDLHSRKLMARYQLTAPQLLCLQAIVDHGPLTAARIADAVYLSPSTLVGILDRLERKGLIERVRDEDDRRLIKLTATQRGLELSKTAPSPLTDSLIRALRRLADQDQESISRSLQRLVKFMEAEDIKAPPILETDQFDAQKSN